eukprot:292481-Chlamydomonas_euryale.AAC.1
MSLKHVNGVASLANQQAKWLRAKAKARLPCAVGRECWLRAMGIAFWLPQATLIGSLLALCTRVVLASWAIWSGAQKHPDGRDLCLCVLTG